MWRNTLKKRVAALEERLPYLEKCIEGRAVVQATVDVTRHNLLDRLETLDLAIRELREWMDQTATSTARLVEENEGRVDVVIQAIQDVETICDGRAERIAKLEADVKADNESWHEHEEAIEHLRQRVGTLEEIVKGLS